MKKLFGLVIVLGLLVGCAQKTESGQSVFNPFQQKTETPTVVQNHYWIINDLGGRAKTATQPASGTYAYNDGEGSFSGPSGTHNQFVRIGSDIGTTNSQNPTGTTTASGSQATTPTQDVKADVGVSFAAQFLAALWGQMQSNQAATAQGPASASAAPQTSSPSVNVSSQPAGGS